MCIYLSDNAVFFLFFAGGFIAGFATLYMIVDYARMRAEHAEKYNCMGIRRLTPNRPTMTLPKNHLSEQNP